MNLPQESRFMRKISPFANWTWDKEVQSQILHALDSLICLTANINMKKGAKKLKPSEIMRPDYVKEAFKEANESKREQNSALNQELAQLFKNKNRVAEE